MYKVLIVDADPQELNTLSQIIAWEDLGLDVIGFFADSRSALESLDDQRVDILIANVRLPHMDGIALLQELRSRGFYTRCIFLASQEDFSYVPKVIPLDIENFLVKPLDPQILSDTLLRAVQKSGSGQEHPAALYAPGGITGRGYPPLLIKHSFEKLMLNQEYGQCFAYLDTLFSDAPNTTPAALKNHIVELAVCIINVLRSCNIEVGDILEDDTDIFSKILSFQDMDQLYLWTKDFLTAATKLLESKNMRYSPCISRVVAHIEKNFAQDISLKTMAYDLNINAAYLGQLFKSETGQLFSVYLNKTRIENAKKLLLETNHTLNEVSLECGYANISYFYNIFKKFTGQTPSQYRKTKTQ